MDLGKHARRDRSRAGFTLVELLIVVAIIGIIASILIPYLIDGIQKGKQKRTVTDMKTVGTCWMSWVTDQVGASAAGSTTRSYDINQLTQIPAADLFQTLYQSQDFFYCQDIPGYDGWGYGLEYFRNTATVLGDTAIAIRSSGRNGIFESDVYSVGPFVTTDYDQDMVWADGLFIRYPSGVVAAGAALP
jgi:general secretion pathway protein G